MHPYNYYNEQLSKIRPMVFPRFDIEETTDYNTYIDDENNNLIYSTTD